MHTGQFTARRFVVAFAIAMAALAAPAVAAFAGSPVASTPRIVADTPNCTESTEPGDASLNCAPESVPDVGAPSEMELTDSNPGINSPGHNHH